MHQERATLTREQIVAEIQDYFNGGAEEMPDPESVACDLVYWAHSLLLGALGASDEAYGFLSSYVDDMRQLDMWPLEFQIKRPQVL